MKKRSCQRLGPADLDRLATDPAIQDQFGPEGAFACVAVETDLLDDSQLPSFARLPVPIIGLALSGENFTQVAKKTCDLLVRDEACVERLVANISAWPTTSALLVQHLRGIAQMDISAALLAESLSFGCLQFGPEFSAWRSEHARVSGRADVSQPILHVTRLDGTLSLTLNRPAARNAIDAGLRDLLCEALDVALADPRIERVTLAGAGRCFSSGGDVAEFGLVSDPVTAHLIRSRRSVAERLLALGPRTRAEVHGAVIGAGLELAACCAHVVAARNSWFQLPELRYGLIPGAGGTVSLSRRIGRHRTAYLAVSQRRISAATALEWGLIDEIAD